ncbi:ABC transporter substrate-binding protein [Gallibacterium trehalosifermentans]|uniref:ABC transporter substrate-binding protein n=1 Tax=Gallibacterium trehalosifermentans TaxID=516935 RepID=A0ABV6GYQ8_9PAST
MIERMLKRILLLLSLLIIHLGSSANPSQLRLASLDWTVSETLIALSAAPIAVGDALRYRQWVATPELAAETVDLGSRLMPNRELLATLPLDKFINSSMYASLTPILATYVGQDNVVIVDFYRVGNIWQNQLAATRQIATLIGQPERGEQLIQQTEQLLQNLKTQISAMTARPILMVQFDDARHLRVYGENSLLGAVAAKLGLQNAWQDPVGIWGTSTVDIHQLAQLAKNSRLVVIKPYPINVPSALAKNSLWQRLPMAKDPIILPTIWTFGGLPSAQRFALALTQALQQGGETW